MNATYFMNDSANNAKAIANAIDGVLNDVHEKERPKLNCRMHSLMHQEQALEKEMSPAAQKANDSLRKILSSSRTHGLYENLGRKYADHAEAEKRRTGAEMPVDAFDAILGCRFGGLNRNAARSAVNFDFIVDFLKKFGENTVADHMAKNKREIVLNFVSVTLVWRNVCCMLWATVAKEQTCADYRLKMEEFTTAATMIKNAASPVEIMRRPNLNKFAEEDESIEGFNKLVDMLLKSDEDREDLETIVRRMIDATVRTYFKFERFPDQDLEVKECIHMIINQFIRA